MRSYRVFINERELDAIVKKYSDIHTVENITAENCDFKIEGWS